MDKKLLLLLNIAENYKNAVDNGDGEYMAIYGRMLDQTTTELRAIAYFSEQELFEVDSELWHKYYQSK